MLNIRQVALSVLLCILLVMAARPSGASTQELLFYSSVPRNLSNVLVNGFQAEHPTVKVNMFQAGTEVVLSKMNLEIKATGHPKADVVWIQDQAAMDGFAKEGQLVQYIPVGDKYVFAPYRDPHSYWTGTFVTHALIMYNSQAIRQNDAPRQWRDLAEPRFRDKVTLADPRVSGTGAVVVAALVQKYGWQFWQAVAKNHPLVETGHPAMVSSIVAGERPIGPELDYFVFQLMRRGDPIHFVVPEEGAIPVGAYVGIIKGTHFEKAAQAFVDFFASRRAAELTRPLGMYSTRSDALPPEGWPPLQRIKLLKFSWAQLERNLAETKTEFAKVMGL